MENGPGPAIATGRGADYTLVRMPVTFACSCGKKYTAPDESAGKQTRCKACGAVVRIPAAKKPATGQTPAVRPPPKPAPKKPAPKPADDDDFGASSGPDKYDLADVPAAKAQAGDLFQGPPPGEGSPDAPGPSLGPAAALYGETSAEKEKKSAGLGNLVPWLIALAVIVAAGLVLKYVVMK